MRHGVSALHYCSSACPRLAQGFCNLSLCVTAPFQVGSWALTAAVVSFLALLEEHKKDLRGPPESMCVLLLGYILRNMLVARGSCPFVHSSVQDQNKPRVSSGVLKSGWTKQLSQLIWYLVSISSQTGCLRKGITAQIQWRFLRILSHVSSNLQHRGCLSQKQWQMLTASPAETTRRHDSDAPQLLRHSNGSEQWVK